MLAVSCSGVRSSAMASRPASSAASSQAVPWRRICSGVVPGQVVAIISGKCRPALSILGIQRPSKRSGAAHCSGQGKAPDGGLQPDVGPAVT